MFLPSDPETRNVMGCLASGVLGLGLLLGLGMALTIYLVLSD